MAGHNKFSKIKRKKAVKDEKRNKYFIKVTRRISLAVAEGGSDPKFNSRLRMAILAAKEAGLPKSRIEETIKKASSPTDTSQYKEMVYEGYAPSGIAVIVEALTNNKNRTAQEIRATFAKYGGSLGEKGCVSYMFKNVGLITYPCKVKSEDEMFELAIDAGAEDCQKVDDEYEILCKLEDFNSAKDYLEKKLGEPSSAKMIWKHNNGLTVNHEKTKEILTLFDVLEDLDDVQNVWSNLEIPDDFNIDDI